MHGRAGRLRWSMLTVLILTSCSTPSEPLPPGVPPGAYLLQSIDERALPTQVPCGVFQAVQGRITLGPERAASYTLNYEALGSGEEISYVGTGSFHVAGPAIVLELHGGWSHQSTTHDHQVWLEAAPQALIERNVGAACDAASSKRYTLGAD